MHVEALPMPYKCGNSWVSIGILVKQGNLYFNGLNINNTQQQRIGSTGGHSTENCDYRNRDVATSIRFMSQSELRWGEYTVCGGDESHDSSTAQNAIHRQIRGGIRVAHLLAKEGFIRKRDVRWEEEGPPVIQRAVVAEEPDLCRTT
ncbi:hypothetical protein GOBAR_AA33235 [Gossypium barbadense]|uniref:Uncharacterized protein n=1 Tax=Gossypium barbadense TaxID=3634 RepID=A0A2P5W8P2_GOSBA|nr:hypothetical protein GOBAR_AA33235 [Gossypium barbadense]